MIDIIWSIFYFIGIEHLPTPSTLEPTPWSHGIFMGAVWSTVAGLITWLISRNRRTSVFMGLLVFSHIVVDFISHPMGDALPGDTGLLLFFNGSPVVGLGLWQYPIARNIGEYGMLILGGIIYVLTLIKLKKEKKRLTQEG
jgi:hypothetical protein